LATSQGHLKGTRNILSSVSGWWFGAPDASSPGA
jgi:hypothetical protein